MLENLQKMLAAGKDNALLRYSLGNEYLKLQQFDTSIEHLQRALDFDPNYSAAWKLLGKALQEAGRLQDAQEVYQKGITVAEVKGDKQAAKEMAVFLKRIQNVI